MLRQLQENIIKDSSLTELESKIDYTFSQKKLLKQALFHPSLQSDFTENYQRLEFLGDSILNYVVTEKLYREFRALPEGELTKKRAKIVNQETLSKVSQSIDLDKYIFFGKSIKSLNDKILSDCYESLIAAILLDSNLNNVKNILGFKYKLLEQFSYHDYFFGLK